MLQLGRMMRFIAAPRVTAIAMAALLTTAYRDAQAFTLTVPDDRPTIQAAIDEGADSVRVRSGYYPERLQIRRGVKIVHHLAPDNHGYNFVAVPRVLGLTVRESYEDDPDRSVVIRGIRFTGGVVLDRRWEQSLYVTFESCRMDSGLFETPDNRDFGITMLNVQGCTIRGGVDVGCATVNFVLNTVIGGGASIFGEGFCNLSGNFVQGPAEYGIRARSDAASVTDNTIIGTTIGLDCLWHTGRAERNEVLDCSGTGIVAASAILTENIVRRCGGNGIEIRDGAVTAMDNFIEAAGGAGILATHGANIVGNVISRCTGPCILAEQSVTATNNTCYLNQGPGIVTQSGGDLRRNIAFSNGGAGLEWSEREPDLECNDWFGNARRPVQGMTRLDGPGPTDLAVDPLFCDVEAGDVHLRVGSPLLNAAGCRQIGALGQGCDAVAGLADVSVEPRVDAVSLEALPMPSRGGVRLSWRALLAPARLEVFDTRGARRWRRDLSAGESDLLWSGTDASGMRLPSGVYFARLTGAGIAMSTRVVLTQ